MELVDTVGADVICNVSVEVAEDVAVGEEVRLEVKVGEGIGVWVGETGI